MNVARRSSLVAGVSLVALAVVALGPGLCDGREGVPRLRVVQLEGQARRRLLPPGQQAGRRLPRPRSGPRRLQALHPQGGLEAEVPRPPHPQARPALADAVRRRRRRQVQARVLRRRQGGRARGADRPRSLPVPRRRLAQRGDEAVSAGRAAGVVGVAVGRCLALPRRGRLDRPQPLEPADRDRVRARDERRQRGGGHRSGARSQRSSGSSARRDASSSRRCSATAARSPASTTRCATSRGSTTTFEVADWAGLVGANRGWLASDGDHVNATGYMARARQIANSAESCG